MAVKKSRQNQLFRVVFLVTVCHFTLSGAVWASPIVKASSPSEKSQVEIWNEIFNVVGALKASDPAKRMEAAFALDLIAPTIAADVSMDAKTLQDEDGNEDSYLDAVKNLDQRIHPVAKTVTHLSGLLTDSDLSVREAAARNLDLLSASLMTSATALRIGLKNRYALIRFHSAKTLRHEVTAIRHILPSLKIYLVREDREIRQRVLAILCEISSVITATANLSDALQDSNPVVRRAAAEALNPMGDTIDEVVSSLSAALNDQDESIRREAAEALNQLGPAVVSPLFNLTRALQIQDTSTRLHAVRALNQIGFGAARAISALNHPSKEQNKDFYETASSFHEHAVTLAISALKIALKDKDALVSQEAAEALQKINQLVLLYRLS